MKALTLWQPWASLLACGAKQYETRSWATSYRGPIAIHAAAVSPLKVLKDVFPLGAWDYHPDFMAKRNFLKALAQSLWPDNIAPGEDYEYLNELDSMPRGHIIATAELVNCWRMVCYPGPNVDIAKNIPIGAELDVPKHHPDFARYIVPTAQEMMFGNWTPGRYAWEFANMKMLETPIPARGGQRIWNWEVSHAG